MEYKTERKGISKMKNIISEKMKIESMKHVTKKIGLTTLEDPEFFYVPLSQHIGQVAKETVKIGDYVHRYEKIGEVSGKVSSMVHSPVSGKVTEIIENPVANGKKVKTVVIKNDFKYKEIETEKRRIEEVGTFRRDEILEIIKEAGIVGEGGAQFPTHVKYDIGYKKIDTFIVNGAECEPYLTADYTIMSNYVEDLLGGIKIAEKLLRPREVVIGIEEENIDIAEHIEVIIKQSRLFNVKIQILPTAYPQGSELQLIRSVTGKEIKKGEIPGNHGVIVSNVGTVKSMYDAFTEGKPLVERVVTVSGEKVKTKGNYLLKVGTPLSHIIEQLNPEDNAKIVFGGPMMGEEVTETSTPVVKGTSGILFLSKDIDSVKRENCISCGYCVDVCPMGLMPMKFAESYRKEQYEKLVTVYHLDNCIECGACEYVCPSRVPLIKSIKEGKEKLRETGEMK
mgnify:FL=1